jgi:hypothetical protein
MSKKKNLISFDFSEDDQDIVGSQEKNVSSIIVDTAKGTALTSDEG